VPDGFRVAALAEDGLMEAVEADDPFALGIQFHPEWLYAGDPSFLKPFEALIASAATFSRANRRRHSS
jgi:putative glutamine amidotransferase